ncbi:prolyl oligopeptidase [Planctomicrobium piriforme]|uniref:prolyl oligopeptidase n=2 Tax=Planctomicrobium piriforme TaxID=1576369 RepID=A0A1I3FA60_9PLAN|nr:prolyl oligopeptidase [Planctomicrobium piriforme]
MTTLGKIGRAGCCLFLISSLLLADESMTKRVDHTDEYFGTKVADPYRWLEDDVRENADVAAWVAMENKQTAAFLEKIPERARINKRLTELWNFEKFGTPFKAGGRIYFFKNNGLQNQYVLYMQETAESEPQVLIDPNTWSADGTVALAGEVFSDDGRYVAYSIQDAGSDWKVWKIMEVATKQLLPDELRWIKFNEPAWTPDGNGFFYARFPEPQAGAQFQNLNVNQAVYYHRVGTPQSEDILVFHRPDQPEWGYSCEVTEDGSYLVITVHVGTDDRYRVFFKDLREPFGQPVSLVNNFENEYSFIGNDGPVFYFQTDLNAPRKRVIAVDTRAIPRGIDVAKKDEPGVPPPYREIIPQQAETITGVSFVGNLFFVESLKDAKTQVALYRPDGGFLRNIDFPGIGSASGFGGKRTDTETYYSFSSFDTPPSIYKYDIFTGSSTLQRQAKVDFDPKQYEVKQVFYQSKDGTKVPMFIAHKAGLKLDGTNPTLLYGYGGFSIPLTPSFSISRLAWMEMGGVFALANLRGGGEYGEEWHKAGTKLNKQNVFDDFIAAAEWLIANKYTQPKKLAIQGGSNGGLLVGACETQRPELFGACLPAVGVMDMLRFQKFTAGRYWVDDYGSSDNAEEFSALLKYSPYHNIKPGVCYPPTMVMTADTDDRVVPGHSFKFAAALQAAQSCENPILIRIETRAGHGAGTPTSKLIEEITDQWSFLVKVLDVKLK